MNKTTTLVIRLNPQLKNLIEKESDKLAMSTSAWTRMVLIKHLEGEK